MEPTQHRSETVSTAALRFAAYAGRPLAPSAPAAPAAEGDARELAKLERQERAARTEHLRQRQMAGPHVHPVSVFRHVIGPDGHGYLREVEVQFDLLAAGEESEATVEKAEAVRRAALAGDFPDRQELLLAAKASLLLALARARQMGADEAAPGTASPSPVPAYLPEPVNEARLSARA